MGQSNTRLPAHNAANEDPHDLNIRPRIPAPILLKLFPPRLLKLELAKGFEPPTL